MYCVCTGRATQLVKGAVVIDQIADSKLLNTLQCMIFMVTTEEATPTMKNLNHYVTKKYAADWRDIGIELDLPLHTLDIISKNNQHECVACFQSTLDNWLKSTTDATWRMLEVAITNVTRQRLGLDPVTDVSDESVIYS